MLPLGIIGWAPSPERVAFGHRDWKQAGGTSVRRARRTFNDAIGLRWRPSDQASGCPVTIAMMNRLTTSDTPVYSPSAAASARSHPHMNVHDKIAVVQMAIRLSGFMMFGSMSFVQDIFVQDVFVQVVFVQVAV
jgi:hypothetical protein